MRNITPTKIAVGAIATALFGLPLAAEAGFVGTNAQTATLPSGNIIHNTQFKISGSKTRDKLRARGYRDIRIEHRGMSKVVATACKDGTKFRLRVGRSGKIRSSQNIGYCGGAGPRISAQEVIDFLRTSGYHHVEIVSDKPPTYKVEACERGSRFSIDVGRHGAILDRSPIGQCGNAHRPPPRQREARSGYGARLPQHVMNRLQDRLFTNIIVLDDTLPEYVVEACKNGKRFEVTTNRRGQIVRRERIGNCQESRPIARAITPDDAQRIIRDQGFRRIQLIDRRLPVYVAKACRDGRRFRVKVDEHGTITRVRRVGICRPQFAATEMRPKEIRYDLRARGFNRIRFVNSTPPIYKVDACRLNNKLRLRINQSGEIVNRTKIGACTDEENVNGYVGTDIKDILKRRRYYNIKLQEKAQYTAEVCRNSRKFQLKMDHFGNVLKRKRIGWCDGPNYPRGNYGKGQQWRERITDAQLDSRDRLMPSRCQDYIEWLLENNSINFDVASAQITDESVPLLRRLAHVANRCPATTIEIAGHTDSDGSDEDNQYLSERRAQSVVRFLRDHNVARSRLSATGYGETRPLVPNDSPWNKALNRRIEFVVDWADDWRFSRRNDR